LPGAGANFAKWMELRRPRRAKKLIPRFGADPQDGGQASLEVTKLHCAQKGGEIGAEGTDGAEMLRSRIDFEDEEDSRARQRRSDGLRDGSGRIGDGGCTHRS